MEENAGLFGGVEPTALAISLCMAANSSRLRRVVSGSSSSRELGARGRELLIGLAINCRASRVSPTDVVDTAVRSQ